VQAPGQVLGQALARVEEQTQVPEPAVLGVEVEEVTEKATEKVLVKVREVVATRLHHHTNVHRKEREPVEVQTQVLELEPRVQVQASYFSYPTTTVSNPT
jgi:hypothetical protein